MQGLWMIHCGGIGSGCYDNVMMMTMKTMTTMALMAAMSLTNRPWDPMACLLNMNRNRPPAIRHAICLSYWANTPSPGRARDAKSSSATLKWKVTRKHKNWHGAAHIYF